MGVAKWFYLVVMSSLVISCGVLTKSVAPEFKPSDVGYSGHLEATFYYTEGIKSVVLYGDTARALKMFDRAIELDSTHSSSYYEAANTLVVHDAARAYKYSSKANRIDSTNIWYRQQLGRLMIINNEYSKALDIYDGLTRESAHDPDNYRMLAALYEQLGQPFTAISVLDSAETKLGKIEELSSFKRQLLINVKLYKMAIAETRELIVSFPFNEENYLILANLYSLTRDDSSALVNYTKALSINPTSVEVIAAMNDYYKNKGDKENFLATAKQLFLSDNVTLKMKIDFFDEITRDKNFYQDYFFQVSDLANTLWIKHPQQYEALELYAGHIIASGNIDEALRLYKLRVGDSVKRIEVFNQILEIEAYLQRPDSVDKYCTLAIDAFEDNADLYVRKGGILVYMKRPKDALKAYKDALNYAQTDSLKGAIYGAIGDMYQSIGNLKKCYANYDKALKLYADNALVLNNYAYFLSEENRLIDRALEMSERSLKLTSNNATYLDTYAWILYRLGRFEDAKKSMRQAISLDRTNSALLALHYGDILYELKDYFMASVYWNKALERGYDAKQVEQRLKLIEGK